MGTRCESVEAYLAKEKRGKKVVYVLNKVDLVPGWVAVRTSLSSNGECFANDMSIVGSLGQNPI